MFQAPHELRDVSAEVLFIHSTSSQFPASLCSNYILL